jgi:hypothetical protein
MTLTSGWWEFILNKPGLLGARFGSMAIENEPAVISDRGESWRQLRELTAASVHRHRLTPLTPELVRLEWRPRQDSNLRPSA